MAQAKVDMNVEYIDANPTDFSEAVQLELAIEREIYDKLKAQQAKVKAAVINEMPMPAGRELKRTAYTRWGQWQLIVGDVVAPKATVSGPRKTLADFIAAQQAAGRRA